MSQQNKPVSWIKIGLTCLSLWLLLKACGGILGIDDRFDSSEGNTAIQTIGEDMKIPIDTMKSAHYAIYAKGAMPADPNMHYRFDIDRQVLDSFVKKQKLKANTKGVLELLRFRFPRRGRADKPLRLGLVKSGCICFGKIIVLVGTHRNSVSSEFL